MILEREGNESLTYAGLASAHDEIWMMFRHVGGSGGGAIAICQPIALLKGHAS